jgi:two-component system, cell cycle sensor histidine kinase and response regulator CckA
MIMAESQRKAVVRGTGGVERRRYQQIARQVSATIGADFFLGLAKQLGQALEADCLYVGEFVGGHVERVRTLAACVDRERMEVFEFPLAGTPDSEVAIGNPCIFSSGLRELFPSDDLLSRLRAEACVGVPLNDSEGQPAGLIIAFYCHPLDDQIHFVQSMLTMFVPRAAAELSRKQADDALREREQRYRAFIMLNAEAMWRLEFEKPIPVDLPEEQQLDSIYRYGYVAECNDALARLHGASRAEELIGARISDLFSHQPEDALHSATESIRAFIRSKYRFGTVETTPVDLAGNRRHLLRSQWGIVENGVLQRIWGSSRDITELKKAESALAHSERRLTELLESLHLLAVMLDRSETISFCNDYLLKLTGWRAEELKGKNWFDVMVPPEDREKLRAVFASALSSSHPGPAHFEGTLKARDGRLRLIEWDSVILFDAKGDICGAAGIGRDITEHRALESQFRQSQKLESIGRLAGGVAHDFNNLLTIVRGYSALLLENRDPADPAYSGLFEIMRAAEKGATLTNQLLSFSRRQLVQPKLLNLNEVIVEDESMLRRLIGADIELTVDRDPFLGFILADPGHIHQVIMNLAVNARDAMPHGGKLIIALSNVDLDEYRAARLSGIESGPYVHLIVADTGVGMTEEVRAHLFEPFFTTKEVNKGTGLGLSTVYGIVRQSGGHIVVESEPGKGTTLEMYFPRVQPPEEAPRVRAGETPQRLRGTETVLLVEDQKDLRALLGTVLRRMGYTVLEADSGQEALLIIDRRREPFDIIVTDIVMPGMSGVELVETVKAAHAETKVLYISGYSDTPNLEQNGFLQKPFPPEALAAKIRKILDRG